MQQDGYINSDFKDLQNILWYEIGIRVDLPAPDDFMEEDIQVIREGPATKTGL